MFDFPFSTHSLATFVLLIGLELVLGIDNVVLISILTGRLPADRQEFARRIGLGIALVARLGLLAGAVYLQRLTEPVVAGLSWRDLVLLFGGVFLLYKATKEIHHVVGTEGEHGKETRAHATLTSVITQIILLDIVFSIDSVITGVGLSSSLAIIYAAVIVSFLLVLMFAKQVADFVHAYPALKILALSFLLCIGVTLCLEAFHHKVPKAYLYLPMGFSIAVELLQMRHDYNRKRSLQAA